MPRNVRAIALATLLAAATSFQAVAQGTDGARRLDAALVLFGEERFSEAIAAFNRLLVDPGAEAQRADAYYWSALASIAAGDLAGASKTIDAFLSLYPRDARVTEMSYQRGRIAFIGKDYERALSLFRSSLAADLSGELAGASVFWSAESLFMLGRLDEAERLFRTVVEKYPRSVKVEAAGYRVALIQYKYREEELLTLLKWSHEESLRVVEDFQRREKAYEQALAVYQRRLGESKEGLSTTQAELESRIADLEARSFELESALAAREESMAALTAALAEARAAGAVDGGSEVDASTPPSPDAARAELLDLKAEALELLAFYLEELAERTEGGAP
ncbi:MAG: tetratricopeptide repeat protein [Spirochaetales bacterium]|nr:tetratricopeptide repeat protein [Spirochaetales bacterium]